MEDDNHTLKLHPIRHYCKRCSNVWEDDVPEPLQCPQCKSFIWDVAPEKYYCKQCGTVWRNKLSDLPRKCPQCGSEDIEYGDVPEGQDIDDRIRDMYRSGDGCLRICMALHASMTQVQSVLRASYPNEPVFKM